MVIIWNMLLSYKAMNLNSAHTQWRVEQSVMHNKSGPAWVLTSDGWCLREYEESSTKWNASASSVITISWADTSSTTPSMQWSSWRHSAPPLKIHTLSPETKWTMCLHKENNGESSKKLLTKIKAWTKF